MKTCSFEGCDDPVRAKGLCMGHYSQQNRGEHLRPKRAARNVKTHGMPCIVPSCTSPIQANDLCHAHYRTSWMMNVHPSELVALDSRPCDLCGKANPGTPAHQLDHDHDCCVDRHSCGDCIRGWLCPSCNNDAKLADFGKPTATERAQEYVARHPRLNLRKAPSSKHEADLKNYGP